MRWCRMNKKSMRTGKVLRLLNEPLLKTLFRILHNRKGVQFLNEASAEKHTEQ